MSQHTNNANIYRTIRVILSLQPVASFTNMV